MKNFAESTRTVIRPLFLSLVCTAALAAGTASAQSAAPSGAAQIEHSMKNGKGMMEMKATGDVDKDFAMMMKMHHEQGVDMAKKELDQGKSPEMKKMARKIIDAQNKEITQFDKWLQSQK